MAEFADAAANDPEDHARLYTAIEKAYVDDRWADVLQQGKALLLNLEADDLELRQRLQLLMAHTHLYGYGDRDAAEDLYRAVLESKTDPSLRQIADQGLQQCGLPLQHESQAVADRPAEAAPQETAADLNPEQLPQAVAARLDSGDVPSQRESLKAFGMALNPTLPELSSVATAAVHPVMPWLATEPEPLPPLTDRAGSLQAEGNEAVDAGGLAAMETTRETTSSPPSAAPISPQTLTPSPTVTSPPSLIPDVIEEPELIEVHQADPSLAEEFELMETGALMEVPTVVMAAPEESLAEDPGFEEDPELLEGLLRVVIR